MKKQLIDKQNETISCGYLIKGDLARFEYPHFTFLINMFRQYQKSGVLPFVGAHSEQPAQIIEAFTILEELDYERQERLRKEAERESRKKK